MRILLLFSTLLFSAGIFAQQPLLDDFEKNVIGPEQMAACGKLEVFDAAPTGNYDLKYLRCEWILDPDTMYIEGSVTSLFVPTENISSIYFDCSDSLIIDEVIYHGFNMTYSLSGNALQINFPATLPMGTADSVTVVYHGTPIGSGFGSFAITEHETANTIWTLSEPYGASDWWPCKQTLNDKIDSVDIYVQCPPGYTSGGPGVLVDTINTLFYTECHWKTNYPIATYLIGVAVSNYESFELTGSSNGTEVPIYNMVYPENFEEAFDGVTAILPSFSLYAEKYGDYPFAAEKYGQLQFGWGGGMEHQTMSSVTSFGYDLLNHEMAHQWFGDKITCGSWQDIWLNEGFATFSSWICYDFSDDPNDYYHAWLKGTRDVIVSKPNGSVFCDDTTSVSRIFDGRLTYYKGGWLLNMLRGQLGDSLFFTGIKNYITDTALIYNFATTPDLIHHLEAAADTSLTEFFNDWYYGQGFPSYHIFWDCDTSGHLTLAMNQTTSDPSVNFFEMKVTLRLKGDSDSMDIVVNNTNPQQFISMNIPFFHG